MDIPSNIKSFLEDITDVEYAVALQFARQHVLKLGLSNNSQIIYSLTIMFCKGVTFSRKWEKLTDDERKTVENYFVPLAQKWFKNIIINNK